MKKLMSVIFILCLFLTACTGEKKNEKVSEKVTRLTIPTYKSGQNVGGIFFLPQVERFNEKYKGQYEIVIEEVPQDSYYEKIKLLAQQKKLPPIIEGGDTDWIQSVVIPNHMYYDLSTWIEETKNVKKVLIPEAVEFNTTKEKEIVSLPLAVIRPIGVYYNTDLLNLEKPIGDMTFDELKKVLGKEKIAFMTAENAWTTSLLLSAILANQTGGVEILQGTETIKDFTSDPWINAFTELQDFLQNYASNNTVGAAYADAANSFMSQNAALIANGPWMTNDFKEESKDKWSNGFSGTKVKADIYPGNIALGTTGMYSYWIPAGLSEEETKGALAFLEFIYSKDELEKYMLAEGGTALMMGEPSKEFLGELKKDTLLYEQYQAIKEDTTIVTPIVERIPNSIRDVEFGKLLPKLIDGSFTPLEFANELTKKAE